MCRIARFPRLLPYFQGFSGVFDSGVLPCSTSWSCEQRPDWQPLRCRDPPVTNTQNRTRRSAIKLQFFSESLNRLLHHRNHTGKKNMTNTDNSTFVMLEKIKVANARHTTEGQPQCARLSASNIESEIVAQAQQSKPQKKECTSKKKIMAVNESGETFEEPNITRRASRTGRVTFMVQIRRRVSGKQYSLSRTFRHLKNAKKWRNKKLLEIDVDGFPIQIVSETTIADVIRDRFARGKKVGRSATHNLEFIRDS